VFLVLTPVLGAQHFVTLTHVRVMGTSSCFNTNFKEHRVLLTSRAHDSKCRSPSVMMDTCWLGITQELNSFNQFDNDMHLPNRTIHHEQDSKCLNGSLSPTRSLRLNIMRSRVMCGCVCVCSCTRRPYPRVYEGTITACFCEWAKSGLQHTTARLLRHHQNDN
jgi:hypothetical protein